MAKFNGNLANLAVGPRLRLRLRRPAVADTITNNYSRWTARMDGGYIPAPAVVFAAQFFGNDNKKQHAGARHKRCKGGRWIISARS